MTMIRVGVFRRSRVLGVGAFPPPPPLINGLLALICPPGLLRHPSRIGAVKHKSVVDPWPNCAGSWPGRGASGLCCSPGPSEGPGRAALEVHGSSPPPPFALARGVAQIWRCPWGGEAFQRSSLGGVSLGVRGWKWENVFFFFLPTFRWTECGAVVCAKRRGGPTPNDGGGLLAGWKSHSRHDLPDLLSKRNFDFFPSSRCREGGGAKRRELSKRGPNRNRQKATSPPPSFKIKGIGRRTLEVSWNNRGCRRLSRRMSHRVFLTKDRGATLREDAVSFSVDLQKCAGNTF